MYKKIKDRFLYIYSTFLSIYKFHPKPVVNNNDVSIILEKGLVSLPSLSNLEIQILEDCKSRHFDNSLNSIKGQASGRTFTHGLLCDELMPILERPQEIIRDILGGRTPNIELTYFQESYPRDSFEDIPGGEPHIDDSKLNYKFFVYLNDVGLDNGPFAVKLYSHGWSGLSKKLRALLWALTVKRFFLYKKNKTRSFLNSFTPIVGAKGTAFLVDTTAWHMALPVISGKRYVFVASFNRK